MARPTGTTETPHSLVKADLKETLKQQKRIRQLFDAQLDEITKRLEADPEIGIAQRLDVLSALAKMSESLTKSMQQAAKYVLADGAEERAKGTSEVSVEQMLREAVSKHS